jgi:hypothetical protein
VSDVIKYVHVLSQRSVSEPFSFIVNVTTTFLLLPVGHNMHDPLEIARYYMNERENICWLYSLSSLTFHYLFMTESNAVE